MDVATEPIVLASSLAAQGSVAAVADGTASAATAAPPAASTANTTYRPRRSAPTVENMDNSLRFANAFDASQTPSGRTDCFPDSETASAHSAIDVAAAANPATEHPGEQQEVRRPP